MACRFRINRRLLRCSVALLRDAPTSAEVFAPDGEWLKPGELRRNPNLAKTYRDDCGAGA